MATQVKIAELRAQLSKYLRSVRKGHEIVIRDRETPIARLVPYKETRDRLQVIPPTRPLKEAVEIMKACMSEKPVFTVDEINEALREERRERLDIDSL